MGTPQTVDLLIRQRGGLSVALPRVFIPAEAQLNTDAGLGHLNAVALKNVVGLLVFQASPPERF